MKIIFNKPKKDRTSYITGICTTVSRVKEKIINNSKSPSFKQYILLVLMIFIGMLSLNLNIKDNKEEDKEEYKTYKLDDEKNKEVTKIKYQTAISSISTNVSTEKNTNKVSSLYRMPTNGQIIKMYSTKELLLSNTLDMWMTHDGIDVSGNLGENVYAITNGVVEDIYKDALYGTSVIINHEGGITSIYNNLNENVEVKEGENVKKENVIGKIGNTAIIEVNDEPHVHLEILKDGNNIDPAIIGLK